MNRFLNTDIDQSQSILYSELTQVLNSYNETLQNPNISIYTPRSLYQVIYSEGYLKSFQLDTYRRSHSIIRAYSRELLKSQNWNLQLGQHLTSNIEHYFSPDMTDFVFDQYILSHYIAPKLKDRKIQTFIESSSGQALVELEELRLLMQERSYQERMGALF